MSSEKDMIVEGMKVANLLKELVQIMKGKMAKGFEGSGMTATQGMVVGSLHRCGKMKVSDLGNQLGLSNSTMSGILDRMEKQGAIERTRSEEDKRVVFVSLSPNFECSHAEFHKKTESIIQEIIDKGTEKEIEEIVKGLTTFKDLLTR